MIRLVLHEVESLIRGREVDRFVVRLVLLPQIFKQLLTFRHLFLAFILSENRGRIRKIYIHEMSGQIKIVPDL